MTHEELMFRDNLAAELVVKMATRPTMNSMLVERSFEIANDVITRIKADHDKLAEELTSKAATIRAARQAEFDELVGGIAACGSTSTNTKPYTAAAQGAGQINQTDRRKADCDGNQLRRAADKVEVRELTPEQALDMIASLIFPPKR